MARVLALGDLRGVRELRGVAQLQPAGGVPVRAGVPPVMVVYKRYADGWMPGRAALRAEMLRCWMKVIDLPEREPCFGDPPR